MSATTPPALPRVVALLTADIVHRDGPNGKFSLLGIFNAISAIEFPAGRPALGIYLAVTDVHGRAEMVVRVIDTDEKSAPLVSATLTVDIPSPLVVAEYGFELPNVQFARPGQYRLQVLCGSDVLADRRIDVMSAGVPIG